MNTIPKRCGFTLIELVAVIAIIGILSVTALAKSKSNSDKAISYIASKLVADIRRVQLFAMATYKPLCIQAIDQSSPVFVNYLVKQLPVDANGAIINTDCSSASEFTINGTAPFAESINSETSAGITLSSTYTPSFDTLGEPLSGSIPPDPSSGYAFTLAASTKHFGIKVHPLTGYVEVEEYTP